uniref:TYR_PHOSPHATASE_2 domain-containing protein n=1 Tax=Panagrellus redivivus TaxID=6233 RepID=A0A7E4ZYV2_PANRE
MSSSSSTSKFKSPRNQEKKRKRQKGPPRPPPGPKLPDRWTNYSPIGEIINDSRFIAFKTPLSDNFFEGKSAPPFGPKSVVDHVSSRGKTLGLVVDLTATTRYYDSSEWKNYDVEYEKIFCEGHTMHKQNTAIKRFVHVVKRYMSNHPGHNMVIGVHCTHGLNRTGFLICRYMIDQMGIEPSKAIQDFEVARGHRIEREQYVTNLRNEEVLKESVTAPHKEHARVKVPEAWDSVADSNWGRRRPVNRSPVRERRRSERSPEREHRRYDRSPEREHRRRDRSLRSPNRDYDDRRSPIRDNRYRRSPSYDPEARRSPIRHHEYRRSHSEHRRRNSIHDPLQMLIEAAYPSSPSNGLWPANPPDLGSVININDLPTIVSKHPRILPPTE